MVTLQILSIWYFILLQDKVAKSLHESPPSLQLLFDPQVSFTIGFNSSRVQLCKYWYTCIMLNYVLLSSLLLPQKQPCNVCNSMDCHKSSISIWFMKYLHVFHLSWKEVQDYELHSEVASHATMSTEILESFTVGLVQQYFKSFLSNCMWGSIVMTYSIPLHVSFKQP